MPRGARSPSSKSRPTRGTTPSCSMCRNSSAIVRGFLDAAARARGCCLDGDDRCCRAATTIGPWRNGARTGRRARRSPGRRRHGRAPARGFSMSAAATASCCGCWKRAASMRAASSCRKKASTIASPRAFRWSRAMPTPISPTIRTTGSITSSCRRPCRRPAIRAGARAHAADRPPCASSRSQISAIGGSGSTSPSAAACRHREPALFLVRHAEHPLLHDQGFPRLPRRRRQDREAVALDGWGRRCASTRPGGSGTCSASRRCFCSAGRISGDSPDAV